MTDVASDDKRDFFVSFNQADHHWATWIAWVLEEKGYSIFFQDWDFRGSFIEQMHQASLRAGRTLVVLSDHYLHSEYARSEAWTALARDPVGREDRVVTVKVGPTTGNLGLFSHFAYLDLTTSAEADAERLILDRARKAVEPDYRAKPSTRPDFPGEATRKVPEKPSFPGVIHNLPHFNPDFVGREPVLAELRGRLTNGRGPTVLSQAISGLGGIGKTQTALAYCYRHLADYMLIWWLRAGSAEVLAADFTTLAASLDLDPATADQAKLIASIRAALQAREGWLLVFDNVEEPELPRAFLPSTGQGHALITSRRTDWQGLAWVLPLEVMEEGEALQLLTDRPDPDTLPIYEFTEAKALSEELGHLPLALAQARAYMAETGKSLAGYRRLLHMSRPAVLARGRASPGYPASVAKTWQISIETAEGACAVARSLLELLAFFSADPLPVVVLAAKSEALPEGLREELARDEAMGALKRFSLIQAEKDTITVHRLVQAVTRDGLDPTTAQARAEAAVQLVAKALPFDADYPSEWPKVEALLPHALAVSVEAERLGVGLAAASAVFNQIALYHLARAAWAAAEPLFQRAIAIGEKALGFEHPNLASYLNNLAELYQATGRLAAAEPLYERVLSILEKALGPEHPNIATVASNLAQLYQATGRLAAAEPLYERVLSILEKALGPEHPNFATYLNNLAGLYQATGRLAAAEPLYERVLSILEKALGFEHPSISTVANNLALLYEVTGRSAEAEPLFQSAIAIGEKALGLEHPNLAIRLNNLALLYSDTGRSAEAEPLFQRAIAIDEKVLGPEHPGLATDLNNLAQLYQATGRLAAAEPLYERVLSILEKALGPEHPSIAKVANNLALLYEVTGRTAEAEPLYRHSIAILERALPPDHPHPRGVRENYADLLDQLGRHSEAAALRAKRRRSSNDASPGDRSTECRR